LTFIPLSGPTIDERRHRPTVRRSQLEPVVDRSMGGCTSSTGVAACAWNPHEGMASELCEYLTDRQLQLVRDTWDVLLNTDGENSAWTDSFVR
jgi:hypothetical protein